jgi:hypothetical protein
MLRRNGVTEATVAATTDSDAAVLRMQRDVLLRRVAAKDGEFQKERDAWKRERMELVKRNKELERQVRELEKGKRT